MPLPYVVAVNTDDMFLRDYGVGNALFGAEAINYKIDPAGDVVDMALSRTGSGRWSRTKGTRVSALIVAESVTPWSITQRTPVLWHHPWATRPLPTDAWRGPQRVPDQATGSMIPVPGTTAAELLGLPLEWPGVGAEFLG